MKLHITQDSFDTKILNRNCFKVLISNTASIENLNELKEALLNLHCAESIFIFTEYNSDLINEITRLGFTLVTTKNMYVKTIAGSLLAPNLVGLKTLSKTEISQRFSLEEFSPLIFSLAQTSRYWKDKYISKEIAIDVYKKWFYNSIYSEFADEVVIALEDHNILGLTSLKKENSIGYIDLIVVDDKAKGRGIGKKLVDAAASYFMSQSIKIIKVETQGENIEGNRFYQKSGFLLETHSLVFHRHAID